jgi:hypothetical protein
MTLTEETEVLGEKPVPVLLFFPPAQQPKKERAASFFRFLHHIHCHTAVVRTLLDEGSALAETSIWKHITLTTDRHTCFWRDSNLQSQ